MKSESWIYLDNNATTKTDERVVQAMLPYFSEVYANPGSSHLFGHSIQERIDDAQDQLAQLIGALRHDIVYTSGATESINLAVKGLKHNARKNIVTVGTEHAAMLESCKYMEAEGFTVTILNVAPSGIVDQELLKKSVNENTCLVSVMLVNNETGVLQPVKELAEIAHAKGALFMSDATQAVGKIFVKVQDLNVDLLSLSGHKFYGPKGIGALYISPKIRNKIGIHVHGGGQQRGRRSGTLNVPGIIGLGKAAELAQAQMETEQKKIGDLVETLESSLLQVSGSSLNGDKKKRIYTTTNICFPGIESERLIPALKNIAVSNGAACSAISVTPSHVLKAMGLSDENALASVRFSLGRFNTPQDIVTTIERVKAMVTKFR